MSQTDYISGNQRAWLHMLRECIKNIDIKDSIELDRARWIVERQETIIYLRKFCEVFGENNDWPDDFHLKDIIQNHLVWPCFGIEV